MHVHFIKMTACVTNEGMAISIHCRHEWMNSRIQNLTQDVISYKTIYIYIFDLCWEFIFESLVNYNEKQNSKSNVYRVLQLKFDSGSLKVGHLNIIAEKIYKQ